MVLIMKELIRDHSLKTNQLIAIQKVIDNFKSIRFPSTLQYMKFVEDVKSIIECE